MREGAEGSNAAYREAVYQHKPVRLKKIRKT